MALSKARKATLLKTSRTRVNRLLDSKNDITLCSPQRAAASIHAVFGYINCRSEPPKVGACVNFQPVCVTTSCKNFCILPRMDGVCLFGMNTCRQFQFL